MDILNTGADLITGTILPHVSKQMNCCYLISMTVLACNSKDYTWHKQHWLLSYAKAVVYGFGADIFLSILSGRSSLEAMSINRSLALIALAWWLYLFLPYNVFYNFLHFKIGNVVPLYVTMTVFATARRMVKTQTAVDVCLAAYPGSYIAILAGALVSNGTQLVAGIFGDFANNIANKTTSRLAITAAIVFTLIKTGVWTFISQSQALAFFVLFGCVIESMEVCNNHFKGLDWIHDALGKIIATKDFVGKN